MTELPEFEAPPLVEVSLGVQFHALPALRPIELGALRDAWRAEYPLVQELPPLPPQIESETPGIPALQFSLGLPQARLWFLTTAQSQLVQVQSDRFIVNWRQTPDDAEYPRYATVREAFQQRLDDLIAFLDDRQFGSIKVTQVEATYINAIDPPPGQTRLGDLTRVFRHWHPLDAHHLAGPDQARAAFAFSVPSLGRPPVRMYVSADPAVRPDGRPAHFLTMTVRGAPVESDRDAALRFLDEAHDHLVHSFAELTPESMHAEWRRTR